MPHPLELEAFSTTLGNLYQGPLESVPWMSFLNELNRLLDSKFVTFILRPPSSSADGLMVNTTGTTAEATASYNQHFYTPSSGCPVARW
jgi:hypothetical protein